VQTPTQFIFPLSRDQRKWSYSCVYGVNQTADRAIKCPACLVWQSALKCQCQVSRFVFQTLGKATALWTSSVPDKCYEIGHSFILTHLPFHHSFQCKDCITYIKVQTFGVKDSREVPCQDQELWHLAAL
jgi:hypothetical protein